MVAYHQTYLSVPAIIQVYVFSISLSRIDTCFPDLIILQNKFMLQDNYALVSEPNEKGKEPLFCAFGSTVKSRLYVFKGKRGKIICISEKNNEKNE